MAACGPGDCLEREGRDRRKLPAALFQLLAPDGVEPGRICPAGPTPSVNGSHQSSKLAYSHLDGQVGVVDVVETGGLEQLGKVARAGPRESDSSASAGIELPNRRPEQAERAPPTGVVPDASGDDPAEDG